VVRVSAGVRAHDLRHPEPGWNREQGAVSLGL